MNKPSLNSWTSGCSARERAVQMGGGRKGHGRLSRWSRWPMWSRWSHRKGHGRSWRWGSGGQRTESHHWSCWECLWRQPHLRLEVICEVCLMCLGGALIPSAAISSCCARKIFTNGIFCVFSLVSLIFLLLRILKNYLELIFQSQKPHICQKWNKHAFGS